MMLRLYGLFACVFLAFVFPMYAYVPSNTLTLYSVSSTIVFGVIVLGIASVADGTAKEIK